MQKLLLPLATLGALSACLAAKVRVNGKDSSSEGLPGRAEKGSDDLGTTEVEIYRP